MRHSKLEWHYYRFIPTTGVVPRPSRLSCFYFGLHFSFLSKTSFNYTKVCSTAVRSSLDHCDEERPPPQKKSRWTLKTMVACINHCANHCINHCINHYINHYINHRIFHCVNHCINQCISTIASTNAYQCINHQPIVVSTIASSTV